MLFAQLEKSHPATVWVDGRFGSGGADWPVHADVNRAAAQIKSSAG